MIITISGYPGSGKSTVGKALAKQLHWKYYSTGDLMSAMAEERGMSLLELTKEAEKSRAIDHELDRRQQQLAKQKQNMVVDGRLSFHFIPRSLKVFLTVDPSIGAARVFGAKRRDEKENTSIEATKKNIAKRLASEKKRYKKYYGIDCYDETHYDIVIDTTEKTGMEVVNEVVGRIKKGGIRTTGGAKNPSGV